MISLIAIVAFTFCLAVPAFSLKARAPIDYQEMGRHALEITNEQNKSDSEIVFSNKAITIYESDLKEAIDMENALDANEISLDDSIEKIIQRKSLLQTALEKGYIATEDEFQQYKESLMSSYQEAENKEDLDEYWNGFGGVENYWKQMKPQIMENLAIRKYLDSQMADYAQKVKSNVKDIDFQQEWAEVENQIKKDAGLKAVTNTELKKILEEAKKLKEKDEME